MANPPKAREAGALSIQTRSADPFLIPKYKIRERLSEQKSLKNRKAKKKMETRDGQLFQKKKKNHLQALSCWIIAALLPIRMQSGIYV